MEFDSKNDFKKNQKFSRNKQIQRNSIKMPPKLLTMASMLLKMTLFFFILPKPSTQTKLIMTVKGGPYSCLAPGVGPNKVLYGDNYDRAYKYDAKKDKDINMYEGGHEIPNSDDFVKITGVVEHPDTKQVITSGIDGSVCFWDPKTNKTVKKLKHVGGIRHAITSMIYAPTQQLFIVLNRTSRNLMYLNLPESEIRGFQYFGESTQNSQILSIKLIKDAPMLLTVSSEAVIRWSAGDPPLQQLTYKINENDEKDPEMSKIIDADAGLAAKLLFIGLKTGQLTSRHLLSGDIEKTIPKAHNSKPIRGVEFMPDLNFLATSGGKIVKIWSRHLNEVEVLTDSKWELGRLVYKEKDLIIGAIMEKGIIFWKQCSIPHCLVCAQSDKCERCKRGYGTNFDGHCFRFGSKELPIPWTFSAVNIDRTRFEVKFLNTSDMIMEAINDLSARARARLWIEGEPDDSRLRYFKPKFRKEEERRAWFIALKFRIGLGIRNLTLELKNKDMRRRSLEPLSDDFRMKNDVSEGHGDYLIAPYSYTRELHFEQRPKKVRLPAMPALPWDMTFIAYWLWLFFRLLLWVLVTFMVLDLVFRYLKFKKLNTMPFLRYVIFYYGLSVFPLIQINFRPAVSEMMEIMYKTAHIGYIIFPEFWLFPGDNTRDYIVPNHKITGYGTTELIIDRLFPEIVIIGILTFLGFSMFSCCRVGLLLNGLRFIFSLVAMFNIIFSGSGQLLNFYLTDLSSYYLDANTWAAFILTVYSALELIYFVVVSVSHEESVLDLEDINNQLHELEAPGVPSDREKGPRNPENRSEASSDRFEDFMKNDQENHQSDRSSKKPSNKGSMSNHLKPPEGLRDRKNSRKLSEASEAKIRDQSLHQHIRPSLTENNFFSRTNHEFNEYALDRKHKIDNFFVDTKKRYKNPEQQENQLGVEELSQSDDNIQEPDEDPAFKILHITTLIAEFSSTHMHLDHFMESFLAKFYHSGLFLRFIAILMLIVFFEPRLRVLEAWIILGINFAFLAICVLISNFLKHKVIYLCEELLMTLWSVEMLVNAYDDIEPRFGLEAFWLFSVVYVFCLTFVMFFETVLVLIHLNTIFRDYLVFDESDKKDVDYRQYGFNMNEEPIVTENRGLNYSEIIVKGLGGGKGKGGDGRGVGTRRGSLGGGVEDFLRGVDEGAEGRKKRKSKSKGKRRKSGKGKKRKRKSSQGKSPKDGGGGGQEVKIN